MFDGGECEESGVDQGKCNAESDFAQVISKVVFPQIARHAAGRTSVIF